VLSVEVKPVRKIHHFVDTSKTGTRAFNEVYANRQGKKIPWRQAFALFLFTDTTWSIALAPAVRNVTPLAGEHLFQTLDVAGKKLLYWQIPGQ